MHSGAKLKRKTKISPLEYALWLLGRRAYSQVEIERKLSAKYSPEEVSSTIGKLLEFKLIDDLALAQEWIRKRDLLRPCSRRLMEFELRKKGVSEKIIREAFESYAQNESISDRQRAEALVNRVKDKAKFQKRDRSEKYKYLLALLARRGFSYEIASEVVQKLE